MKCKVLFPMNNDQNPHGFLQQPLIYPGVRLIHAVTFVLI